MSAKGTKLSHSRWGTFKCASPTSALFPSIIIYSIQSLCKWELWDQAQILTCRYVLCKCKELWHMFRFRVCFIINDFFYPVGDVGPWLQETCSNKADWEWNEGVCVYVCADVCMDVGCVGACMSTILDRACELGGRDLSMSVRRCLFRALGASRVRHSNLTISHRGRG